MKESALHGAARNGHADVCEVLLNHGADANAQDNVSKMTDRNIPHASPFLMSGYVSGNIQLCIG